MTRSLLSIRRVLADVILERKASTPPACQGTRAMVICHCEGVTDREIDEARRRGARTPDDLARLCGAGTGCGGCREVLEEILGATSPIETTMSGAIGSSRQGVHELDEEEPE